MFPWQKMAALFQEFLGSRIIREPLDKDAPMFPSPQQLRGRVIIKHRKIDSSDPFPGDRVRPPCMAAGSNWFIYCSQR